MKIVDRYSYFNIQVVFEFLVFLNVTTTIPNIFNMNQNTFFQRFGIEIVVVRVSYHSLRSISIKSLQHRSGGGIFLRNTHVS